MIHTARLIIFDGDVLHFYTEGLILYGSCLLRFNSI